MARKNEELNQAIWTVLSTQFKKQAKEAFKTVQENGYEVYKNGCGTWTVKNPHTDKTMHIEQGCYRTILCYGRNSRRWNKLAEEQAIAKHFDFVNCLRTPHNREYYEVEARESWRQESKSHEQYDRIKSAKWSIQYETDRIAKIQKEIAKLQDELIRATESRVSDKARLENLRKEFGLVK